MKKLLFLFVLGLIATILPAQDNYTYITDRKFGDVEDLIGFNFCPFKVEVRDEMDSELGPCEYSFGITRSNLYVAGEEIKGVYSLNNINTTDYGFKMLLMNARDPTIQGHLKIIQNPKDQVEALIFKRSNKDPEMIFFLAEIPEGVNAQESEFFTDITDSPIDAPDSLWGKTIYPFLKIHNDVGTQERLQPEDSTSISFIEKVTIIDKTKKKKVKKKKKNKKQENMANIELGLMDGEEAEEEAIEEITEEVADEMMEETEAPELQVDDGAMPPITEEMVEKEAKKNLKIIKEYFVKVRSIITYDDGSTEDKEWMYPVKKVTQREDAMAGPTEERYQLEFALLKGNPIYLYLMTDKSVSSMEIGPKMYLMRGH